MTRRYDESLSAIQEMQQAGTAVYKVEDMEFGRRLAVERELELPGPDGKIPGMWSNAIWDESGAFVLYPTLLGIKGTLQPGDNCLSRARAYGICDSCKHCNESCCETTWEGRDRSVDELDYVSRRACEEGPNDSCKLSVYIFVL